MGLSRKTKDTLIRNILFLAALSSIVALGLIMVRTS